MELTDLRGQVSLTRKRDIFHFRAPRFNSKTGTYCWKSCFPFSFLPTEHKQQSGIHSLGSFLHVLRCHDAAIIFSQDDVDRSAQLGKEKKGIDPHREEDHQDGDGSKEEAAV